jgi:acyl-CoA thioesterase I
MGIADSKTYLQDIIDNLKTQWPDNRLVNVVCHGHSVPAGYFATPMVDTFNAYPHLVHVGLKNLFPFGVINVIVTAIGGETSLAGAERFEREALCHRPDVLTIDYALNDRSVGLSEAEKAWRSMVEKALAGGIKVILMTPTPDIGESKSTGVTELRHHAEQIRRLADEYGTGLVDSLAAFDDYVKRGGNLGDLLSWANHPNRKGHELVAKEILRWFPAWV